MRHIHVNRDIRLPQLVIASLSAAALALGLSTVHTTTATAEPGVWDLDKFKQCLEENLQGNPDPNYIYETQKLCCMDSDGVWDYKRAECVAPPAQPAKHDASDIGTETLTPSRPRPIPVPSDIGTETFTPAATPTPPPTPATTKAPPVAVKPCLDPQDPTCLPSNG